MTTKSTRRKTSRMKSSMTGIITAMTGDEDDWLTMVTAMAAMEDEGDGDGGEGDGDDDDGDNAGDDDEGDGYGWRC